MAPLIFLRATLTVTFGFDLQSHGAHTAEILRPVKRSIAWTGPISHAFPPQARLTIN